MNKLITLAFLLGMLSFSFASCGDDDGNDDTGGVIKEDVAHYAVNMGDGTTYWIDTNLVQRVIDEKVVSSISIHWPANVKIKHNVGYGEEVEFEASYAHAPTRVCYFGNKLLMLVDTYRDYGLPGYAYLFAKDLSSYEVKEIVGGKPSAWDETKLAIFGFGTEYALYDTSFNTLAKGKVDALRFDHSTGYADKIAFGTYKGEYYALVDVKYAETQDSTCVLNMTTAKLSPLKINRKLNDIDDFFPNEEKKPRYEYTFSFNEDHFEVTYNVTFYSGEKTTLVRKFDLEGNEY